MKAVDPTLLAVTLMQQCLNGFRDEHHHKGWRKKWAKEIEALPAALNRAVLYAWDQATARVDDDNQDYSYDEECDARSGLPDVGDK